MDFANDLAQTEVFILFRKAEFLAEWKYLPGVPKKKRNHNVFVLTSLGIEPMMIKYLTSGKRSLPLSY